jgi:nitroimidazol reductase NimA-like FMN-containing flavoprotein (pyridoxamine 5'-phosphate oxidase superfamily)
VPDLRELDQRTSERLLRSAGSGRLVVAGEDGPEIVPVRYEVRTTTLVVRIPRGGDVSRWCAGRPVALVVDVLDLGRWRGWSVVARGIGDVVTAPDPSADSGTEVELRIAWAELHGRAFGPVADREEAAAWSWRW